ncbi:hypothetical protein G7K_5813-t1 [Saitoella complicata NRRL Y-17804]|uniref:Uncharacterized protein n=1 Tax=Saitoella complicata (strain BCRC 22490 / CBS 7301 / JCM 7358 / NBRC 10748 / NRRL Y-17804) TaxID=698492 RepID=A0A0E9NQL9_SAICN|nr:hypothetical protein G7K_5813-t1 [Saitoella complicata NRRL Y-17804]
MMKLAPGDVVDKKQCRRRKTVDMKVYLSDSYLELTERHSKKILPFLHNLLLSQRIKRGDALSRRDRSPCRRPPPPLPQPWPQQQGRPQQRRQQGQQRQRKPQGWQGTP